MSAYVYVAFALILVAVGVAYAFYVQLNALRSKDDARREEAEAATSLAQKAQKELDGVREDLSRRRSEAADLREKLNDLRSRQHKLRESDRKQKGGFEAELNDQIEAARRRVEEEQARVDVLSRETKGMQDELGRLRDSNRKLEETLKAAQAASAARVAAAAAAPAPVPVATAEGAAPAAPAVDESQKRVELLERQTREARRKVGEFEEELKRARSKGSNATRLHLLTKNELDLFKEKMVWSEKRVVELERLLFDNKIALPERAVSPQPKAPQVAPGILAREAANTGGEGVVAVSADYIPEPASEEAEPEQAGVEQAAVEPAPEPVAEVAAAELATTEADRMEAVPPIRRPRTVVESRTDEPAAKPD